MIIEYIVRRALLAVPILFGVFLVTFLLFHLVAGDPAELMAGKNASPLERDTLRRALHMDRPLFWGHWCKTELYRTDAATLRRAAAPPQETNRPARDGAIRLPAGAVLVLPREWNETPAPCVRVKIGFDGRLLVNDRPLAPGFGGTASTVFEYAPDRLVLKAGPEGALIRFVTVRRRRNNPWDSQFFRALREIVDVRRDPETGKLRVVCLDFGRTLVTREPIREVLKRGVGPSLALTVPIFILELTTALIVAMVAAWWRDTWLDRVLVLLCVAGMSISYLVYIVVGQFVLGYYFNWFPVWGCESWRYYVLPVLVGVASGLGASVRFYRSVFIEEVNRPHIRTALAKGLHPLRVMLVHVLPNAIIPVITRVAVVLPFLYTGSLLLESFFGIPGLGYAGVNALANADLQLLKALVLIGAFLFVAANLAADVLYAWVDPRVRLR